MEKTKEQILMEKLRKAGRMTRMKPGMPHLPMFPGMGRMPAPMGGPLPGFGPGPKPGCGRGPMGGPGFPMPREMLLLTVLENGEQGMRQKDIADAIGINASSLSEQIDALETDRYIERKANPEDKRSTLIVLTEKGRARAYEVQDERQKMAADFCKKLTEAEKDTLIELLDKLLEGSV